MEERANAQHESLAVADVVVITGMSGAGRTHAMHVFEDLGYYVIDNLPPSLLLPLAEIVGIQSGIGRHLACVCDLRSQGLFDQLLEEVGKLEGHEISCSVLFLDASDEALRRRYALSRRRHPIAQGGESNLHAIRRERAQLQGVRAAADVVIDTTNLRPAELTRAIERLYSELSAQQMMEVHVFSFGFKYGMPPEADLLIDVRFLPNPFWDPTMRALSGKDARVRDFVLEHGQTKAFLDAWERLLDTVLPGYVAEGKSYLSIGVGCSGGQHRSVVLADATAAHLKDRGYRVSVSHRDLPKAKLDPLITAEDGAPAAQGGSSDAASSPASTRAEG